MGGSSGPMGGSSGPMLHTQATNWGGSQGGSERWSAGVGGDGGAAVAAALREEVAKLKGALEVVQKEKDDVSEKMYRSQAEVERMQAETKLIVQRSQDAMAELEQHRDELAAKRSADTDTAMEMKKLKEERDEMHNVLLRERDNMARARSDIEAEMEKQVAAARKEGEEEAGKLLKERFLEVERRSMDENARMQDEILGLERQLQVERDRASQACDTADKHHEQEIAAEERLKEQQQKHEEEVRELQKELASLEAQKIEQDNIAQSKVSRLCVIALPHAVAKLHDFLYQKSGAHPSGAGGAYEHPSTWAQVLSLCMPSRMFLLLATTPATRSNIFFVA
jgi:chromosome segregation ATPase